MAPCSAFTKAAPTCRYNSGRFATAAGVLLAGLLFSALGGDYAKVGTICAMIYALGLVVIWFAPDTSRNDFNS